MKTGWKVLITVVAVGIVGAFGFGAVDTFSMEHRPSGKKTCAVVGLAQGTITFGDKHQSIWLECPEMKRKRAIEVNVGDPKKFTVGGRATCSLLAAYGGVSGMDRTSRDGMLVDCEPTA